MGKIRQKLASIRTHLREQHPIFAVLEDFRLRGAAVPGTVLSVFQGFILRVAAAGYTV